MARLHIPLSGAQGGGKTSLLNELSRRGHHVDDFRVSRAVQAQLGWNSLDRVMDSPQTMMQFQEEVFRQKYANDRALHVQSNSVTLMERSFADIVAYTTVWMWKFVDRGDLTFAEATDWLVPYTSACVKAQQDIYQGMLILPMMSHVTFEHDPHRAKKEDVEAVFENLERFMDKAAFINFPKLVISAKSIEERADQVEAFLRSLS